LTNFDRAFEQAKNLVEDFQSNESKYLSSDYQEAEVRRDFIDKFLFALGWDVYHNEQKNPYEQEVKVEKSVHVGRQQKRADYAFHLQPNYRDVKFYVEAKKPSKNLYNADDYWQTCRYGWNAGNTIVVLTDFEEFHILDCRIRPDISTILDNKIKQFHFTDYLNKEKFAEIFWLFSREAVADNSLEKFAVSLPKPRGKAIQKGFFKGGYQSIDEAFLEELDEIRDSLARAFKKSNPHLESDELTEMIQRTIDRLVFIRFLEDKQIEPDHYVSEFGDSKTAWKDFLVSSRKLNAKYNGIVFKKSSIDSNNIIEPDDKTFSNICEELAHINSPYNFDIIPIHILGSIYERFLGKVVVATDKRVRIEEKPEVRKAGGVYYTPQYIVNYIVDNTVGKLIEGKTPKEISKMRFADISCGSGSFLITVFDRLLDYHGKWYQQNPEQAKKDKCIEHDGKWVLSLKQKQKILTNNIYGVDLDHQAVEVTQLSLYLKLLEDETTATAYETWVMFKEQLLPSLSDNIVCGNSLIGTDIIDGRLFDWDNEKKLKPMNFEDAFPKVMGKGGFDAIVGNPPYGAELYDDEYLSQKYFYASKLKEINSFLFFIEKSWKLLNNEGKMGYIVPDTILLKIQYEKFRKFLRNETNIFEIIELGTVFQQAKATPNILLFINKTFINQNTIITRKQINPNQTISKILDDFRIRNWFAEGKISYSEWDKFPNLQLGRYVQKEKVRLIEKIMDHQSVICLGNFDSINIDRGLEGGKSSLLENYSKGMYRIIIPENVDRYSITEEPLYYTSEIKPSFLYDRIVLIRIRNTKIEQRLVASIIPKKIATLKTLQQIYLIKKNKIDLKYLLALINSTLLNFYCSHFLTDDVNKDYINQLPLPLNLDSYEKHNQIARLVENIIDAKKIKIKSIIESEKEYLEKKCSTLDRQIDKLVYELYGLTEEEIKIVEGTEIKE